jgi:hypothetical protein
MQAASCVVCQERVNLLAQKLVTVQWVDGKSGTLLALTFHSDCYVRWYGETSRGTQKPPSESSPKKDAPLATLPPRASTAVPPGETPERVLTPDELKRLEQLRGRRDTDVAPRPSDAGDAAGTQTQDPDHQDDRAPDEKQPEDRHDVAPPDV